MNSNPSNESRAIRGRHFRHGFLVLLTVFASLISGCSTQSYLSNRVLDATDVVTLTLGYGLGAGVRVGPLYANSIYFGYADLLGVRHGTLIFPGDQAGGDIGGWIAFGHTSIHPSEDAKKRGKTFDYASTGRGSPFLMQPRYARSDTKASEAPVFYGQIEVAAGLIPGVRLGVNVFELLDLVFGIATVDIMRDDIFPEREDDDTEDKSENLLVIDKTFGG